MICCRLGVSRSEGSPCVVARIGGITVIGWLLGDAKRPARVLKSDESQKDRVDYSKEYRVGKPFRLKMSENWFCEANESMGKQIEIEAVVKDMPRSSNTESGDGRGGKRAWT